MRSTSTQSQNSKGGRESKAPDCPPIQTTRPELTDSQIRRLIIQDSIQKYPGNCPCPYNSASDGSACGGRSAYSRPGGYSPLCYERDVSDAMVKQIRKQLPPTASYTSQKLGNANQLQPGMSKTQVTQIMGCAVRTEFQGPIEEWHYCRTGQSADEFVTLYLRDSVLIGSSFYTVGGDEGFEGDCTLNIKRGGYVEPQYLR